MTGVQTCALPIYVPGTAEFVRSQIPAATIDRSAIYSSPSTRCLVLARALAAPREPIASEQLHEMSFGAWQGLCWQSIAREHIDAWAGDLWGYRPGGGESANMVAARWESWLQELRVAGSDTVIAITHAGVIRVALDSSGSAPRSSCLDAKIPFGSVHRLEIRQ